MFYVHILFKIINSYKNIVVIIYLIKGIYKITTPSQNNKSIFHVYIIKGFLKPPSGPSPDEPQSRDQYCDHKGYTSYGQQTAQALALEGRRPFYGKRHLRL